MNSFFLFFFHSKIFAASKIQRFGTCILFLPFFAIFHAYLVIVDIFIPCRHRYFSANLDSRGAARIEIFQLLFRIGHFSRYDMNIRNFGCCRFHGKIDRLTFRNSEGKFSSGPMRSVFFISARPCSAPGLTFSDLRTMPGNTLCEAESPASRR